jgi:hypothetical protein
MSVPDPKQSMKALILLPEAGAGSGKKPGRLVGQPVKTPVLRY